jgi:hypothetical protein
VEIGLSDSTVQLGRSTGQNLVLLRYEREAPDVLITAVSGG